jgi:hypothetical protein
MTKTWDVVNELSPPPVGSFVVRRLRQTDEASLLCCAATRGQVCSGCILELAVSALIHFLKRCQRVASGVE